MSTRMPALLRWCALLTGVTRFFVGCDGEPDPPNCNQQNIAAVLDHEELPADGALCGSIGISASCLNGGAPTASGVEITITNAEGAPTGTLGGASSSRQLLILDAQGASSAEYCCDEVTTMGIMARLDSGEAGGGTVHCLEPDCQLHIVSFTANGWGTETPFLSPGERLELVAEVDGCDGAPPRFPVSIEFKITDRSSSGNIGFGSQRDSSIESTIAEFEANAFLLAGDQTTSETVTIEANFVSQQAGNDPHTITINFGLPEPSVRLEPRVILLPADGLSENIVQAAVFRAEGVVQAFATVELSVDGGSLTVAEEAEEAEEISLDVDGLGQVSATYVAGIEAGNFELMARVDPQNFSPNATGEVLDTIPIRLFIPGTDEESAQYLGTTPELLGLQGCDWQESATACFAFLDSEGETYPEGQVVGFEISSTSTGARLIAETALTDNLGHACASFASGTTSGQISVSACLRVGDVETCVDDMEEVTVVGCTASRAFLEFECAAPLVGALRWLSGDEITPMVGEELCTTCTLTLRDRNDNPVGYPHELHFLAESGLFETMDGLSLAVRALENRSSGVNQVRWCASGPMPEDVDPYEDEPSWYDETADQTRNPRDGLVTLVAWVLGEEQFEDINGNGSWDELPGTGDPEPVFDQPEPFIDTDDNNYFDPTIDTFVDANIEDDHFDESNGLWDAETAIWVQTRTLLVGPPHFEEQERTDDPIFSHWRVSDSTGDDLGTYWQVNPLSPGCSGAASDHCFYVPETGNFNIDYVPVDWLGTPLSDSIGPVLTYYFERSGCDDAIDLNLTTHFPGEGPFPFDLFISEDLTDDTDDLTYEVTIESFDSPKFTFAASIDLTQLETLRNCELSMEAPVTPCSGCPTDTGPWPSFVLAAP